jgi:hypothetical protein
VAMPSTRLDALKASEPWQRLRPTQRTWVLAVIATGDERFATQFAYPKASVKSREPMRCEIRRSKRIRAALAFWNGPAKSTQETIDQLAAANQQLKSELAAMDAVLTKLFTNLNARLSCPKSAPDFMAQAMNGFWNQLEAKSGITQISEAN